MTEFVVGHYGGFDRLAAKALAAAKEKHPGIVLRCYRHTIRQSARDIQIALKSEMQERLRNVVKGCAGQALSPEMMAGLILEMARSYAANPADKIEVLLPAASVKYLSDGILAGLGEDLRNRTTILGENEMNGGLQIGFRDGDVFLDFSDEALADIICAYAGPKLSAILKG